MSGSISSRIRITRSQSLPDRLKQRASILGMLPVPAALGRGARGFARTLPAARIGREIANDARESLDVAGLVAERGLAERRFEAGLRQCPRHQHRNSRGEIGEDLVR